jgi:hypothetical protein
LLLLLLLPGEVLLLLHVEERRGPELVLVGQPRVVERAAIDAVEAAGLRKLRLLLQ